MTDDERLPDAEAAAQGLPRGSLIVLRARNEDRRARLAVRLVPIARRRSLFLSIADDPELAARIGADGVHFPELHMGDIAAWRARRPHWLLTAAAHSLGAALRAASFGADALFLSPVFATASHPGRASLTPIRLRAITRSLRVPAYALGGIDARSALQLKGAKLAGLAAIGALLISP
jgi:thiamine-phosphate pyrophosphorylase